jgi:hypothetical protein
MSEIVKVLLTLFGMGMLPPPRAMMSGQPAAGAVPLGYVIVDWNDTVLPL